MLDVTALTLRSGPNNLELYAALRNNGDVPACHAALSVELFDRDEQSIAGGINGLLTQHFYRLTDGSETIAACVGPGDVTMVAVTDLPANIRPEDVGAIVYRCPYFALDVAPVQGLAIRGLKRHAAGAETIYTGKLVNELAVALKNPSVTVFPINRAGRPLGIATSNGTTEVPPGGDWSFETDSVDAAGVDQVAFPAGALDE